ncbi:MAG: CpaE family protein [Actinomycetota bacterium]
MSDSGVVAVGTPQSFRQQLARALEVEPDDLDWVPSATAAEELIVNADNPVDVLVLSPEVKEPDALGLAEFVGRSAPATAIVMVRDHSWNGLLPAAMRAGIRDVVDLTQGAQELRDAVDRAIAWASNLRSLRGAMADNPAQRGMVVSIFSSKGGTGKTMLTTNLATAIADVTGKDTAAVDLDVDMGDVFSYFGIEPKFQIQDLIDLGEGANRETILNHAHKITDNLYAFGAQPDPTVETPGGEAVGKFLRALRSTFPYIVVDASADYTDLALSCFDLSDAICLVTALDVVGVKHLSKALDTLVGIGIPRDRFRIVLNRADSKVGLDAQDVERVMKIRVDQMIPSSRDVPMSLNRGKPVYLEQPNSPITKSIRELATRLTGASAKNREGDEQPAEDKSKKRRLFART